MVDTSLRSSNSCKVRNSVARQQLGAWHAGPHKSRLACGPHNVNGKYVLGEIDADGDNGGLGLPLPKKSE